MSQSSLCENRISWCVIGVCHIKWGVILQCTPAPACLIEWVSVYQHQYRSTEIPRTQIVTGRKSWDVSGLNFFLLRSVNGCSHRLTPMGQLLQYLKWIIDCVAKSLILSHAFIYFCLPFFRWEKVCVHRMSQTLHAQRPSLKARQDPYEQETADCYQQQRRHHSLTWRCFACSRNRSRHRSGFSKWPAHHRYHGNLICRELGSISQQWY